MRTLLSAALLLAMLQAPVVAGGSGGASLCAASSPSRVPVPATLAIPGPYPTATDWSIGCASRGGPPGVPVTSTTASCPPPPPSPNLSVVLAGEYCGKLYLPLQRVSVSASASFTFPTTGFHVVVGFDETATGVPYNGNLDPGEAVCVSPSPPAPAATLSITVECTVPARVPNPSDPTPPLPRLIAWLEVPGDNPILSGPDLGYAPPGLGSGP